MMKKHLLLLVSLLLAFALMLSLGACKRWDDDAEGGSQNGSENGSQNGGENGIENGGENGGDDNKENAESLAYTISADESYYIVSGIGSCTGGGLVIPDTYLGLPVKEIAPSAFEGNTVITDISFGINLLSIGDRAFYGCINVTVLIIPDNVTVISDSAFSGCTGLKTVNIGNGVTTLGNSAFSGCTGIVNLQLGGNITLIGDFAFYLCVNITILVVPDTVTVIGKSAFHGCEGLTNVQFGEGLTEIKESAFEKCSGLVNITFGGNVTMIGNLAFYLCINIKYVYLPSTIVHVGNNAFGGIPNVYHYTDGTSFPDSWGEHWWGDDEFYNKIFFYDGDWEITVDGELNLYIGGWEIHIEPTCTEEGVEYRSCLNKGFVYKTVPAKGHSLTEYAGKSADCTSHGYLSHWYCSNCYRAFKDADAKERMDSYILVSPGHQMEGNECTVCHQIYSDGFVWEKSSDGSYMILKGIGTCSDTDIIIPPTVEGLPVKEIYSQAFNNKAITSVIIPEGVTKIGQYAFSGCSKLQVVKLPDSLIEIGWGAFQSCGIKYLFIPKNVQTMDKNAFSSCSYLEEIYFNAANMNDLHQQSVVFDNAGNKGNGLRITIGKDVTRVPAYLFAGYYSSTGFNPFTKIIGLEFEAGSVCTTIGQRAFTNLQGSFELVIPDSVTEIFACFYSCSGIKKLTIGKGLTTIGDSAFIGCTGLREVIIPDNITTIGSSAFNGCTMLEKVIISDNVTVIKDSAFYRCSSLLSIVLPKNLTKLDQHVFSLSGITEIIIPDSVTMIDNQAFYGCRNLKKIYIGKGVESIGSQAFASCSNIEYIYFNAVSAKDVTGNYPFNNSGHGSTGMVMVIGKDAKRIPGRLFTCYDVNFLAPSRPNLVRVEFEEGSVCEEIGNGAFNRMYDLTIDSLPDSLKTIGNNAFAYCKSIVSVVIPDGVTSIGTYAFDTCTSLRKIVIGSSVTSIGQKAFSTCYELVEIYNKSSLDIKKGQSNDNGTLNGNIAKYALAVYIDINEESRVVVDDAGYVFYVNGDEIYLVTYSGDKSELILPEYYDGKVYKLREFMFSYRNDFTALVVPGTVKEIPRLAFTSCSGLKTIIFHEGVEKIGDFAFDFVDKIETLVIPGSMTYIGRCAFRMGASTSGYNLNALYYGGSEESWSNINIVSLNDSGNAPYAFVTRYYYSEAATETEGNFWHFVNGVPTAWVSEENS